MRDDKPKEWNIAATASSVLLYTLKHDGWRKGEEIMVNDMTVRLENANGSNNDLMKNALRMMAADDMYDALWETIELSDRNLTEAGRTPECQRVYDIVRAALKRAEGE